MSAQLPCPSASPGAASGPVIRGKIGIATQRQRERAFLLAQVDKSCEPALDKTHVFTRAAPATPSSVERVHRLPQRSATKQVYVPLRASTLSLILDQLTELPPSINDVASLVFELPATIPKLLPTVKRVAGGEQHVVGGGGGALEAPSTPPSKAPQGKTLDDHNDPYYRCTAHRMCLSMGDQTLQFLMCFNCNEPVYLFCAEYLLEQKPVNKDTLYITLQDFTKEGKARWKKTSLDKKDNVAFCIFCLAKMKAVKVLAAANKLAKRQPTSSGKAPKKKMKFSKGYHRDNL